MEIPMNTETVDERIEGLLTRLRELNRKYFAEHYPRSEVPEISSTMGKKWIKVIRETSVYAFIHMQTGEIFFPAGWRAPAKHARGNVYAEDYGMSCCNVSSVAYLK